MIVEVELKGYHNFDRFHVHHMMVTKLGGMMDERGMMDLVMANVVMTKVAGLDNFVASNVHATWQDLLDEDDQ